MHGAGDASEGENEKTSSQPFLMFAWEKLNIALYCLSHSLSDSLAQLHIGNTAETVSQ